MELFISQNLIFFNFPLTFAISMDFKKNEHTREIHNLDNSPLKFKIFATVKRVAWKNNFFIGQCACMISLNFHFSYTLHFLIMMDKYLLLSECSVYWFLHIDGSFTCEFYWINEMSNIKSPQHTRRIKANY